MTDEDQSVEPELGTIADRAWYAWHCMPRDSEGRPVSIWILEQGGFGFGTLNKVMSGREMREPRLRRVAALLQVDPEWLIRGEGEPPQPTGPVPPRVERSRAGERTS